MIFNPLFFNETGNSQMLAPKSNKLSNNKYLFSDIVKVVMNPEREQKKLLETNIENIFNTEAKIIPGKDQLPEELKLKLLNNFDSEKAKIDLADILPDDIAQLLIDEDADVNNAKAVSYLSKEPLNSGLQVFLNNLVGEKILKQNINKNTGVLLSLEDNKSAVNIELIQGPYGKTQKDKIIVQTLVVPEKSKLISLFNNMGKNIIKNGESTSFGNINKELNVSTTLLNNEAVENSKPTLSVYSFKHSTGEVNNLITDTKIASKSKLNLGMLNNLIKDNRQEIKSGKEQVSLNKISFIPSEYKGKTESKTIDSNHLETPKIKNNSAGKLQVESIKNDYNISKITIVKKQLDTNNILKNDLYVKNLSSTLRKIDFTDKSGNKLTNLHIFKNNKNIQKDDQTIPTKKESNTANITEAKSKNDNLRILNNTNLSQASGNKDETNDNLKILQKENVKEVKSNNTVRQELEKVKIDTNNKQDVKTEKINTEQTEKIKSNIKYGDNKPVDKLENNLKIAEVTKRNVNENSPKPEVNSKTLDTVIKSGENVIKSEKVEISAEPKSNNPVNKADTVKEEKNSTEKNSIKKSEVNERINVSEKKNETEISNDPRLRSENKKSTAADKIKGTHKNTNNSEAIVNNNEPTANLINTESVKAGKNKRISVKVKGEVKNVSDKNHSGTENTNIKENEEGRYTSKNGSPENNTNGNTKQTMSFNNPINIKNNHEVNFQTALNKEGIKTGEVPAAQTINNDTQLKQRIIKSTEVIREITRFISQKSNGSFSFKIEPEHLGKMKITIDTVDNILKATIEVDSEKAKQLIERNINKLHTQLSENGVELNSLNISLGYSKQKNREEEISNKKYNQSNNNSQVGEIEEEQQQTKSLGYNTYEYIA